MNTKIVAAAAAVVAVLAGAAAAWHKGWLGAPAASISSVIGSKGAAGEAFRKCQRGAQIEYTNGPCPAGTREQGVGAGTLSVLPAPPAPAGSAAGPALRELAKSVDPREMQERAIDRAIGR